MPRGLGLRESTGNVAAFNDLCGWLSKDVSWRCWWFEQCEPLETLTSVAGSSRHVGLNFESSP